MKLLRTFGAGLAFVVLLATTGTAATRPQTPAPLSGSLKTPVKVFPAPPAQTSALGKSEKAKGSSGDPSDLTGLLNAIAHVSANLADHPNAGLRNALGHLRANQAKHAAKRAGKAGKTKSSATGR